MIRNESPAAGRFGGIAVGSRVFIGARAILMPGVIVGDGSIVGAVVTTDVAPGAVVARVPARVMSAIENYKQRTLTEYPLPMGGQSGGPLSSAEFRRRREEFHPPR